MGRRGRSKRGTPYSKGDIREQYCINNKEVQVLESDSPSALFGCLSKHHDSNCHSRNSFLSVCVGRVPSDENLHDLSRQPLPRRPVEDLERAYMRRRPKSICGVDPTRYAWIPEDEEPLKPEHGRPISVDRDDEGIGLRRGHQMSFSSEHLATSCPAHYLPPPPPPPAGIPRTKHVSFARSHTLTSFDDAMMELRRTPPGIFKSQERLILSTQPVRKAGLITSPHSIYEPRVIKKAPMKTQATQTGCLAREPPKYLSLSPRTVHRVKMVSQGAQTNGQLWNGRRLMKSYSEAGYQFCMDVQEADKSKEHDALTRTQSEEPRSPYMKQPSLPWPPVAQPPMMMEERKRSRSSKVYREIFIDFEPVECEQPSRHSLTQSDGEFMSEHSMEMDGPVVDRVDGVKVSLSSYSTLDEDMDEMDMLDTRHHGLQRTQDSVDEEFHENLVYGGIFKKQSEPSLEMDIHEEKILHGSAESSPEEKGERLPVATLGVSLRASPFASSDSLATDHRADHSDGIWNESQAAESDNGEINSRNPSKRQLLLLQHQQRSSIDTEVLEDDVLHSQSPAYSPMKQESTVPFVTIAAVHQYDAPSTVHMGISQGDRKPLLIYPGSLTPVIRDSRRRSLKSPEKDEELPVRGDSGKITDISETSTTEDYATAHDNSGTDTSSKRSPRPAQQSIKQGSKEGSSFDSAASISREEGAQAVPSSPPPISEEKFEVVEHEDKEDIEEKVLEEKEDVSASMESSSSGSYSVDSGQKEPKAEWTDQERVRIKKGFKLDLSDHSANEPETWSEGEGGDGPTRLTSPRQSKPKAGGIALRRTQQGPGKKWGAKGNGEVAPGMVRSPAMPEGFRGEDWVPPQRSTPSHTPEETLAAGKNGVEVSSDESSCEHKITGIEETINGHSPRRQRRRGGGRGQRRRPLAPLAPVPANQQQLSPSATKYCRSPGHSPRGSPRKGMKPGTKAEVRKNAESPEIAFHLKALSAESLRSVSPGSDSVFYNEGETHLLLCHQCGREVEAEPLVEATEEIVQPPAGFADSPENTRSKSHRLFKKQEKRFRSEERSGERRRHQRFRADGLRAKSEERGKEKGSRTKLRPHARSTDASMERLRGADSSPSISEPLVDSEPRVYSEVFSRSSWICITEAESGWDRSLDTDEDHIENVKREASDSTSSEKDFKRKYQAATHRMVHRKSSMEMYRRLQSKTFGDTKPPTLRERLEDILRLMLVVWCAQTKALITVGAECDKKVVVRRKSGEFGFRIHGSRPVVVSAIEPDTPAESSGLEVGDIVLSVNGVSVLEAPHSEVVKLAHAGSDTLELEVARACEALTPVAKDTGSILFTGYLHKYGIDGKWHERWFVLKSDDCLYYYKSQADNHPLGALMLINYKLTMTPESGVAHSFKLEQHGAKSLELSADSKESLERWKSRLEKAMQAEVSSKHHWLEKSCQLLSQPASSVSQPDCFGHLTQLEDKWRRRYCVLKDAALLLYADSNAARALAIACLQGYRVQSTGTAGKKFSFEVIPPESKLKHFYFYTDTEMDKKRWIAAIEYSIDRWMRVG